MALWNGYKGYACSHSSCGGGAPPRHAVDFGRRDFLIDALAATAGLGLGGCAAPVMQASGKADTILVNARIATLAPRAPAASALGASVAMRALTRIVSALPLACMTGAAQPPSPSPAVAASASIRKSRRPKSTAWRGGAPPPHDEWLQAYPLYPFQSAM